MHAYLSLNSILNEWHCFPVCLRMNHVDLSVYMLLSPRERLQRWPQFRCQRRRQCIQVSYHARQWLHLQRLFFTLSEGLLYHTVFIKIIIIISGCRSFFWSPLLLIFTFHKHILQRQESKEQVRWEMRWNVLHHMLKLLKLDGAESSLCSYHKEVVIMGI